ncbi:MAG: ATP synthase F1 subunit epsilon [Fimbriimonadaceae bacterium]|nr:ATP synthase F1 subunit epsilon [Fimbriimonadaceae bacterium]QYK58424.1 MAG: ATP synthase F1 subunit epsilon [Fimbriimonadaceae bacterium]
MARALTLSVVAPDRTVFEGQVTSLVAPGVEGYLGVMAGHEPTIAALATGIVEATDTANQREHIAIGGGFMEVSGESAIILAEDARRAREIDLAEEQALLESARKALRGEESSMTSEQAQKEIDRAMTRIKAARLS